MGQLGHQEPRKQHTVKKETIEAIIENCQEIAEKYRVDIGHVLKACEIAEMARRTTTYVNNGDNFDEQAGGFGELFSSLNDKMGEISEALKEIAEK